MEGEEGLEREKQYESSGYTRRDAHSEPLKPKPRTVSSNRGDHSLGKEKSCPHLSPNTLLPNTSSRPAPGPLVLLLLAPPSCRRSIMICTEFQLERVPSRMNSNLCEQLAVCWCVFLSLSKPL